MNINTEKSELFLSPNCKKNKRRWFNGILEVKGVSKPSRYLGLELGKLKDKKGFFQPIMKKMHNRIAGWKTKLLSQVGKLTLLKSTLESIPLYALSCVKAPTNICRKIDQISRNFLWGHEANQRKLHMISWNKLCKPKSRGGLGILNIEARNLSLLGKQAWRIGMNPDSLIRRTLLPKYCKNTAFWDCIPRNNDTWIWKSILLGKEVCKQGTEIQIRDEKDTWIVNGKCQILNDQNRQYSIPVQDLFCPITNNWKWDLNNKNLDQETMNVIKSSTITSDTGKDMLVWKFTRNGEYTVKSVYWKVCNKEENTIHQGGQQIFPDFI
ncbi:hypothetical protein PTKIN_Ptkin03bG0062300 [Pterospermum kingtungense]